MKTTISVLLTLIIVLSGTVGAVYYQKMVFDSALDAYEQKITVLQNSLSSAESTIDEKDSEINNLKNPVTTSPIVIVGANVINLDSDDKQKNNLVAIDFAILEAPGFVVIHRVMNGVPSEVIGHSKLLQTGRNGEFTISLDLSAAKYYSEDSYCDVPGCVPPKDLVLQDGERFIAMLHLDNGDGVYTSLDEDLPAKDSLGNVVMMEGGVTTSAQ